MSQKQPLISILHIKKKIIFIKNYRVIKLCHQKNIVINIQRLSVNFFTLKSQLKHSVECILLLANVKSFKRHISHENTTVNFQKYFEKNLANNYNYKSTKNKCGDNNVTILTLFRNSI